MNSSCQEYEAEMRSYQIPVKEFFIEDPPDYGDVFIPTPVPILTKKVTSKGIWLPEGRFYKVMTI